MVNGRHYTDLVEPIKQLKREDKLDKAIILLEAAIEATEREAAVAGRGWGVAPWYYEQLAMIYRWQGKPEKEKEILERHERRKNQ